jgi:signal transduction histidine kinase
LGLIRTLRGLTSTFGCLDAHDYSEYDTELRFAGNPGLALAEFFYWTRKLQARFFAGDYATAVEASRKAQQLIWPAASQVETGDFRFYAALAHAAASSSASAEARHEHFEALNDHHRQLEIWALHCPANFETKTALVGAEIARMDGRMPDAEHLYETAIRSAHDNGFAHCEAVANECAARFYSARGFAKIALLYWRDARDCYRDWGADAKVRQLEECHPQLKAEKSASDTGTILASVEQLDLATVIRVSEAVAGEIEEEKLIDTLMRTAIEHAGAERGILILPRANEYRIEAEATTGADGLTVALRPAKITAADLPASVFQFVLRTGESVLLHDAAGDDAFSTDEYIHQRGIRSMLCLPLLKQTHLLGILYLENNLSGDVFTPARMTVLKLLASAAAVSLENTRLYSDLREREARVRRLVESNIESERRYHDIQIQLEHASRVATLGQLSASIAHEVNQPLTGAMTNAHTALLCLRSVAPDMDLVREALTRIVRDCGRASDVVGRIRALVKKAPPRKELVQINDAIEDVVALTYAEALKGRITCRTQLSPELPVIALDRVQLQQVVLNLIMNAVEAMSHIEQEDREIVISTAADGECMRVSVRDNGPGVDEVNRERIFDAFHSTKPSGLGLGLSICRSIIEAHGGRLLASNALPRGAIFEFTLPLESGRTP